VTVLKEASVSHRAKAILRHFRKLSFMLSLKIKDSEYATKLSFWYAPYVTILTAGVLYVYRAIKPEVHWTIWVLWIWMAPCPVPPSAQAE